MASNRFEMNHGYWAWELSDSASDVAAALLTKLAHTQCGRAQCEPNILYLAPEAPTEPAEVKPA